MAESSDISTFPNPKSKEDYFARNTSPYLSTNNSFVEKILSFRILNHLIFWILSIIITSYQGSLFGGTFADNLLNMAILLPVQIMVAYLLVYWQIPRLAFAQKWIPFFMSLIVVAYFSAVIARVITIYIAEPLIGIDDIKEPIIEIMADPINLIKVYVVIIYLPAFILFLIKMTKERFANAQRLSVLQKEKQTAELNFLKAQMNPHFLFNTLNNIYALAKNKSEQTPEMIMKLSEILDYTIYDCNDDRVNINQEWELIENYVDLEALRYHKELDLEIHKNIDNEQAQIAPLILITIVENAFKFGLANAKQTPRISIRLEVIGKHLTFAVINSKANKRNEITKIKKRGIGNSNIEKQLSLQYPNRHKIETKETKDQYKVTLSISL